MGTSDVDIERQACSIHTERQAVERCAECGRAVCLACAVPFRGRVLCTTCAARALGERTPPEPPVPIRSRRPDLVAGALLASGLLLTIPPWHRFGPLTERFTAWAFETDPWSAIGAVLLAVALVVAVIPAVLRLGSWRAQAAGYGGASLLAGLAVLRSVLGAPDYVRHTPIPFLVLTVAIAVGVLGAVRMARAPRTVPPG